MRVLSVAFPDVPVGTPSSGGAEQILSILDAGFVTRGHQSVVVARQGSKTTGDLIEIAEGPGKAIGKAIERALNRYAIDLIHFHGLDFHRYLPDCVPPMMATLHLPVSFYPDSIFDTFLNCVCVSRSQAESTPASRSLPVIPNGIPVRSYAPAEPGDYLLWLGRICPEKGVQIALDVARRLSARLIVAGPVHSYAEHREYFARSVQPLLDADRTYCGPVAHAEKKSLLAGARCLLVPSLVAETSSLAAMEALGSGAPVVAFRSGALPEIVDHGETGFIVDSAEEMAQAVSRVSRISRSLCRERALQRFDCERMIDGYLALYGRIITRHFRIGAAPQENL